MVHNAIYDQLLTNNLPSPAQLGFQKKCCCSSCQLVFRPNLYAQKEDYFLLLQSILFFAKGLDQLSYYMLFVKLSAYEIDRNLLSRISRA